MERFCCCPYRKYLAVQVVAIRLGGVGLFKGMKIRSKQSQSHMQSLKSFLSCHQRKMTLLQDNHAGALYNYLISVQTGHRKNAGTTANVKLTDKQQQQKQTLYSPNIWGIF